MKKSDLLTEMSDELDNIIEQKLKNVRYNFLDVIKENCYHEYLISNWLEFLLNPTKNGVGNEIIKALLRCTEEYKQECFDIDNQEFESIEREATTDNHKSIDLLIKYSERWIVIENKINALETCDEGIGYFQTNEYYNYISDQDEIKNGKVKATYIYLKPRKNISKPKNGNFEQVYYENFIDELKKINIEFYPEDERYKYRYLEEFENIGECFMEKNYGIDDEVKFCAKYMTEINTIIKNYEHRNKILWDKISNEIECNFKEEGYKICQKICWIQLYKEKWKNNNNNGVHFELGFKQGSDNKILGRENVDNVIVQLHAESGTPEKVLQRLENDNIVKKSKNSLYLCQKEENGRLKEICISKEVYDFSSEEKINESIEKIEKNFKILIEQYENIIDTAFGKLEEQII